MKKILVVEDSSFFGRMLKNKLAAETGAKVRWVTTMAEAVTLVRDDASEYLAAIVNFNLPDAPKGEVVDQLVRCDLPVVVFTSVVSKEVRDQIWSQKVVDYVLKEGVQSLDYLVALLRRLERNPRTEVLVVDDSALPRETIAGLLRVHRYQVYEAEDGQQALQIMARHPQIKLVISDFHMPQMDGFELTQALRKSWSKDDLAIIGISARGDNVMAARFLKCGANDFMVKQSFLTEEFYCRVSQNIESLENIAAIRRASATDFLTGLPNRRYLFDNGVGLWQRAADSRAPLACAMFDIDHFKRINDNFGHEAGDRAIQHVAEILRQALPAEAVVARMGGEEFCALLPQAGDAAVCCESIRRTLELSALEVPGTGAPIRLTISIGLTCEPGASLDAMINRADALLYRAKEEGRNRLVC
ncbi:MAG: diguanylate cyclase [Syntrophotaleaceae bacterium]